MSSSFASQLAGRKTRRAGSVDEAGALWEGIWSRGSLNVTPPGLISRACAARRIPPSPVSLPEHDPEQTTHNHRGRGGRTKNRTAAPVNRLAAPSEFRHFVLGGVNRSGLAPLRQRGRIAAKYAKGKMRKVGQGRKRLHA